MLVINAPFEEFEFVLHFPMRISCPRATSMGSAQTPYQFDQEIHKHPLKIESRIRKDTVVTVYVFT